MATESANGENGLTVDEKNADLRTPISKKIANTIVTTEKEDIFIDWGFPLPELYKLALTFYKEKEGKALHLSYGDKLQLVARSQQVSLGPFDPNVAPPVGYLDVIGRDRRQAWQALSTMGRDDAMQQFVNILDTACSLFRPYVEAHKRDVEERERLLREEKERCRQKAIEEQEQKRIEEETRRREELELRRLEAQRQQIQEALNQQTCYQFKAYAQQQFPTNEEQQAVLIRQLQEQHYQQYIQQVYQQQQQHQLQHSLTQPSLPIETRLTDDVNEDRGNHLSDDDDDDENGIEGGESEGGSSSDDQTPDLSSPVKPASMWTRKDIVEFKSSIQKEGGDSILKVGHGETVTVRVPTHEDGTCLFWEFATDSYDIGFGVYFEWTKTPGTQVSVHISESEEEEEDEDETARGDVEKGGAMPNLETEPQAPVTVIIPIYRRDCHDEVYAGSHVYPGQGVYLLKFDNSYSLWRSKTLYYRVYYTH